jgi:hypothetical protein
MEDNMKCTECQFTNREGVDFYEECGAKLELICPIWGVTTASGKFGSNKFFLILESF